MLKRMFLLNFVVFPNLREHVEDFSWHVATFYFGRLFNSLLDFLEKTQCVELGDLYQFLGLIREVMILQNRFVLLQVVYEAHGNPRHIVAIVDKPFDVYNEGSSFRQAEDVVKMGFHFWPEQPFLRL